MNISGTETGPRGMTWDEADRVFRLFGNPPRLRYLSRSVYTFGDYVSSPRELAQVSASLHDTNMYVLMNRTADYGSHKPSAKDMTEWNWFLLDIDPMLPDADPFAAAGFYVGALQSVLGLMVVKPVLIFSGRGVQAWFYLGRHPLNVRLSRPTGPDILWALRPRMSDYITNPHADYINATTDLMWMPAREIARRAMNYWLNYLANRWPMMHGCALDTSVSDLPRVMRMPYTINQKTGRRSLIVQGERHEHPSLVHKLIDYAPRDVFKPAPPPPPGMADKPWKDFLPFVNRTAREFILLGATEPGRHKAMSAAVKSLFEAGCPIETARIAVARGTVLCVPPLVDQGSIDRAFRTTYGGN